MMMGNKNISGVQLALVVVVVVRSSGNNSTWNPNDPCFDSSSGLVLGG